MIYVALVLLYLMLVILYFTIRSMQSTLDSLTEISILQTALIDKLMKDYLKRMSRSVPNGAAEQSAIIDSILREHYATKGH